MQIELRSLAEIRPYPNNPRANDSAIEAVANSIRAFGFRVPIIVDADGVIVAGHTRLAAARLLGLAEAPVLVAADLTPEQVRAYRIADNQTGNLSAWNEELLFRELDDLRAAEFDLSALGFSELELARILAPDGTDGFTDPDAIPAEPDRAEADSQPSTLYALGRHRLLCGEVGDTDDMARLMAGAKADMLLSRVTPRPEGVTALLSVAGGALKPGGAFYLWHDPTDRNRLRRECREAGWEVRQGLLWLKDAAVPEDGLDYARQHEVCAYGWKDGASHQWFSDRSQTTIIELERSVVDGTPLEDLPVELFAYLIGNSCPPGGLVLDPDAGTGATALAAERRGVRACLVTPTPTLCDVARRRYAEFVHGPGCDWRVLTPALSDADAPWA